MSHRKLKRGDVYIAKIWFPDNHKNSFKKYVVILQDERKFERCPTVAVFKLTTQHLDRLFSTDVFVPPDECGVLAGAKIITNQPYTIRKKYDLIEFKYSLSPETLNALDAAIEKSLGLSQT